MPQLMQSLVDWLTTPVGALGHLELRFAPRMPGRLRPSSFWTTLAASHVLSPNDRMWLKIRLKPAVNWLMFWGEKIWVSETATLRPWLLIFCVLPKALCSANPGEPPGTKEFA